MKRHEESEIHITKRKKPIWKGYILCEILENAKLWDNQQSQGVMGEGRMNRQSREDS